MDEPGLEMDASDVPRLGKALDRARLVAAVVCGIVIIIPATTGLLSQASQAKVISWAFLGAAIAVITSACFPRLRPHAGLLVATGGLLLLLSPLLSLDVQARWLALPTVTVATCAVAALALPPRPAVPIILAASMLCWLNADRPPALLHAPGLPAAFVPSLALLMGLGFALAMSRLQAQVDLADERTDTLRTLNETTARQSALLHARMATERRIHETVLNTLNGISLGAGAGRHQQARDACTRDLQELQSSSPPPATTPLAQIIEDSIEAVGAVGLDVICDVQADEQLSARTAIVLRDAIVESLRNVERHAGVDRVNLMARQGDGCTEVTIVDDGIGLTTADLERFGQHNGVVRGIEAVAGTYQLQPTRSASSNGVGTTVRIRVPNGNPSDARPLDDGSAVAELGLTTLQFGQSSSARIGMLGVVACLALWVPWMATSFIAPAWPVGLMVAFVVLNITLTIAWHTSWRPFIAAAVVIASLSTMLVLAIQPDQCVAESALDAAGRESMGVTVGVAFGIPVGMAIALMNGGGLFLALLGLPRGRARLITVGASGLACVLLTLSVPSSCRPSLQTSFDITVFLAGFAYALHWIDVIFVRSQSAAQLAWRRFAHERADAQAAATALQAWSKVDDETRDLLQAIASGELDIDDEPTRERAKAAAARVRARLREGASPSTEPDYVQQIRGLMTRLPKPIVIGSVQRQDPPDSAVIARIGEVIEASGPGPWTWHLVTAGPASQGTEQHVLRGPAPIEATTGQHSEQIADCSLSIVTNLEQTSVHLVRPAASVLLPGSGA